MSFINNKTPMLKLLLNSKIVDTHLIADVIRVICFLTNETPAKIGELSYKDIKSMISFNELVTEFYGNNFNKMQETFSREQTLAVVKLFKTAIIQDPLGYNLADFEIAANELIR